MEGYVCKNGKGGACVSRVLCTRLRMGKQEGGPGVGREGEGRSVFARGEGEGEEVFPLLEVEVFLLVELSLLVRRGRMTKWKTEENGCQ